MCHCCARTVHVLTRERKKELVVDVAALVDTSFLELPSQGLVPWCKPLTHFKPQNAQASGRAGANC